MLGWPPSVRKTVGSILLLGMTLLFCSPFWAAEVPAPHYEATRELMAFVRGAADLIVESDLEVACLELKDPASPWFVGESYVFVFDMEGHALCHPSRPELEGQNLVELRDPHGIPIVAQFLKEISGDKIEGWIHYLWPPPGKKTFYWKSTYLRKIKDSDGKNLIVGSGRWGMKLEPFFLVDKVQDAVRLLETQGTKAFTTLKDPAAGYRFLDAYVFVMREDGEQQVNVAFPEVEGSNMLEFTDTEGKAIAQEMLKVVQSQGEGWVDYLWPRPGDTVSTRKRSFVKGVVVDHRLYIVGAGMYFDDGLEIGVTIPKVKAEIP